MKRILILLLIPFFSCGQDLNRGETIDKMSRDVQQFLPYDFGNGLVWTQSINEDDLRNVKIYNVSEEGISVVKSLTKNEIMGQLRAVPNDEGFKISKEKKIINVWRYYFKDNLIKEIIVNPDEW